MKTFHFTFFLSKLKSFFLFLFLPAKCLGSGLIEEQDITIHVSKKASKYFSMLLRGDIRAQYM